MYTISTRPVHLPGSGLVLEHDKGLPVFPLTVADLSRKRLRKHSAMAVGHSALSGDQFMHSYLRAPHPYLKDFIVAFTLGFLGVTLWRLI